MVALVKRERLAGRPPVTNVGVVAQVWRRAWSAGAGGRLLAGVEVVPVDDSLVRREGFSLVLNGLRVSRLDRVRRR